VKLEIINTKKIDFNIIFINKYYIMSINFTSTNEIIGNDDNIKYIKDWLNRYFEIKDKLKNNGILRKSSKGRKKKISNIKEEDIEDNKRKGSLIITGLHGCGKTTIINLILKELKYDIININNLDSHTIINTEFIIKITNKNFYENNKKVLLIDELESIITTNDKENIFNIIKENNFGRWMPIIIITNNQHNKKLNEIKKYSNEIKIKSLNNDEILILLNKISKINNINFINDDIKKNMIEHSQNDIRRLIMLLDEIKITYNDNIIDNEKYNKFIEILKKKNKDLDLFGATEKLLKNYTNINDCLELQQTESTLIPLMIDENSYKFINYDKYNEVLETFSKADILENYIFEEQNWDLCDIFGYVSCSIPSYLINKYSNKNNMNKKIVFATDLNRTSVKKMNYKNIIKTNEILINENKNIRHKTIDEFIYMSEIINNNK